MAEKSVERLIPLKSTWFQILAALADGERAGFSIMEEVTRRTGGKVRLWPATLYNTLKQMWDADLIDQSDARPLPTEDQRRRYYRLTSLGRQVLEAELQRLERMVQTVRAKQAVGESGSAQ